MWAHWCPRWSPCSGEARNTSNQRTLTEFEKHLSEAEAKAESSQASMEKTSKLLIDVSAGIDHLHDKVRDLAPPAPSASRGQLTLFPAT